MSLLISFNVSWFRFWYVSRTVLGEELFLPKHITTFGVLMMAVEESAF